MRALTIGWTEIPKAGDLWPQYFQLRKNEFIDNKHWDLPYSDTAEFDCYDTPFAKFIIIEENGECVGGARILRTDAPNYGPYSYMLRDAQNGTIEGIPQKLIPPDLPQRSNWYEATRFFTKRDLGTKQTIRVQRSIVREIFSYVEGVGGGTIVALMPSHIYRIFRRFGFDVTEHSQTEMIDGRVHSVGFLKVSAKPSPGNI